MKLLFYCNKAKPYLYKTEDTTYPAYPIGYHTDKDLKLKLFNTNELANLNGKIITECDYDIEPVDLNSDNFDWLLEATDITMQELQKYVGNSKSLYAIHIKNLHIFDKPKNVFNYYQRTKGIYIGEHLTNTPRRMMCCTDILGDDYIMVPVSPQEMCRIVNKEQTILLRKKILKG